MADVSTSDRKVKITKNGKVVKRRLRNPEGKSKICALRSLCS